MFFNIFDTSFACTLAYFGGTYTDDGSNLFLRIEDGCTNDENKLYIVSQAGKYKAGEEYNSCYGFKWNFTHDSYRYIARMDDNIGMVCPNCGKDHSHQPYQEAGTNEYGLTVTCTNSVDANSKISKVDPYIEKGVSEAEMATVLLSECSNASVAIELLKHLVETEGSHREGFAIKLCDQNEQWYVESIASHYFLAIPLSENLVFFNYIGYEFLDCTGVYHIFPEGWDKSYSYTYNALTNYLCFLASDEEKELAARYYADMQKDFNARFKELSADLMKETDPSKRQEIMTREHASMSRESQETALALYRHFKYGEELPDSPDVHGFDLKYVIIVLCGVIVLFGIIYLCIKRNYRS